MDNNYDFCGYATRNDLTCTDGRTIRRNAFKAQDGTQVPLVWMHQHNDPQAVIGHAILENRDDGVYAYGYLNDTENGKSAKEFLKHGDIRSLSIWANQLKQVGSDVIHGTIRELSLCLAGANEGAYIDYVLAHADGQEDCIDACYDENIMIIAHAENTGKKDDEKDDTVEDIINSMNEKQKNVLFAMVGEALEAEPEEDDEDGGEEMKHNSFDDATKDQTQTTYLSHADQEMIVRNAKQIGKLSAAMEAFTSENELQHDAIASGFEQSGSPANISYLFPEYHDVRSGAPELLTSDQGWISRVLGKVHKSPFSRIRTGYVDIRNIETLRAKGYFKGKQKKLTGNYNLVRRTTDPQTIYVKHALHRDDIVDVTDFDLVAYQYNIDRMMLNEELATAIMIGDGRSEGDEDKIRPEHIRPIWLDDDLYTMHRELDLDKAGKEIQGSNTAGAFGENYILAEAMVNECLYAREKYKGSGTPDMYITPHMLNVMLLARDMNGRRIYSSKQELATVLGVGSIETVEQFEGKVRKDTNGKQHKLLCLICNLADYTLGSTKGGEITHFTQFDIDFNQEKSLLETRVSGSLTKVYSAIAIEEAVAEDGEREDS